MGSSVLFARRKKSPFKGPMLNPSAFGTSGTAAGSLGSPALFGGGGRPREASASHLNTGLLDAAPRAQRPRPQQRKSMIITEEEEEPAEGEEEEIEEVEAFPPVNLRRGESVHSIVFIDDPRLDEDNEAAWEDEDGVAIPPVPKLDISKVNQGLEDALKEYEEKHGLDHAKGSLEHKTTHDLVTRDDNVQPSSVSTAGEGGKAQ